jgi:hypothetical protein
MTREARGNRRGRVGRSDPTQISIRFDDLTFETIRERAKTEKTSFAEQVRTLVEWGLESAA